MKVELNPPEDPTLAQFEEGVIDMYRVLVKASENQEYARAVQICLSMNKLKITSSESVSDGRGRRTNEHHLLKSMLKDCVRVMGIMECKNGIDRLELSAVMKRIREYEERG